MGKTIVHMSAQKQKSLQEIHEVIHYIRGTEQVCKNVQNINGVEIWTLVYEKFFFRNGSYASLSIILTEFDNKQTAVLVGSGGGEGLFNFNWGADRDYVKSCEKALQECGFETILV